MRRRFFVPGVSDIMGRMDVYLTRQALLQVEALTRISDRSEGILCGHRRAQRFFVEYILPIPGVTSAPPERMESLRGLLQESLLGYFRIGAGPDEAATGQDPGSVGRVFLEVHPREGKTPELAASMVDFDGAFRLQPLKIKKER